MKKSKEEITKDFTLFKKLSWMFFGVFIVLSGIYISFIIVDMGIRQLSAPYTFLIHLDFIVLFFLNLSMLTLVLLGEVAMKGKLLELQVKEING